MSGAPASTRPVWAEVDLGALRGNYRALRRRLRPGVEVIASIKANAYGHGVVPVARALGAEGVLALATGAFEDAVAVREAGVRTPIVLFGGPLPEAMTEVLRHDLTPTVYDLAGAEAVSGEAERPTPVWIEVDAGLGRLGVALEHAEGFVRDVAALPHVAVEGIYTHLPFVDADGLAWAADRLAAFRSLLGALERSGLAVDVTQALSSAGALAGLDDGCTAVCPGHVLYGLAPASPDVVGLSGFRRVLRAVKTRLIHVARHGGARSAGVGGRTQLAPGSVTGVVPFGRYDGYRDARAGSAAMLVRGRRVPVLGISLEHVTLDLTGVGDAAVGEEVVVVGKQQGQEIALEELAAWQGVGAVDVLLNLERRMPFRYLDEHALEATQPGIAAARR
jgi:alanine racemase